MIAAPGQARIGALCALLICLAPTGGQVLAQEDPSAPLAVGETVVSDDEIAERIREFTRALGDYENVAVNVSNGVVRLSGEVVEARDIARLEALARRVDGVARWKRRSRRPAT